MQAHRTLFAAIAVSMCTGAAAFFGGHAPGLLPSAALRSNTQGSVSLRPAPIPLLSTVRRRGEAWGAGVVMMAKKKLTDAQIKALQALEQFEAIETAGAPAPVVEEPKMEKKKTKKKKGPWVPGQDAEKEGAAADSVPDIAAAAPEAEAAPAPVVVEEEEALAPVMAKDEKAEEQGKQKKKGGIAGGLLDELFAGEEEEAFDPFAEDPDEAPKLSKKKQGKEKKGKKGAVAESEAGVVSEDGEEEVEVEVKVAKKRPPPKVRIDTSAQPGFVSLRLKNIGITFKGQDVLTDASWAVSTGDRVGLVGANGGGKTTQLRILSGELEATTGDIIKSSADLKLAFLRQEFVDELISTRTLKEELLSVFTEEAAILKELDEVTAELETTGGDTARMQVVLDRMEKLQKMADGKSVSTLDSRVEKILDTMGFQPEEGDNLVASFSGGWKMRIGLGKILLTKPNILLLDEPTNHLDLESIEWMESFLINQNIPMVIVSHDREFLDKVCTKIVDTESGVTSSYDGNYSRFMKMKRERQEAWQASYDAQMKRVKGDKDFINRFKVGAQAAQAASRQKRLEKQMASDDWVRKPPTPGKKLRFRFPAAPRMGDGYAVCNIKNVKHGYAERPGKEVLFQDVDFSVEKGERVAFLGPNGCGKSTLLRLVVGNEAPNEGKCLLGGGDNENLAVNYYEQNQADCLDLDLTVLKTMQLATDGTVEYEELRALLGQFLFKGDTVDKKLSVLSGGEKARVALCRMMLKPCNLMVLDEPTNHLDIPAKEMLEEALQYYDGTLLVISHDRYFISQVANVIAAFEDKRLARYNGDYKHYMDVNNEWRAKVEARYLDGIEGIKELPQMDDAVDEKEKKKKNFGGSAVTSGRKDKGVKNAKRSGDSM